MLDQALGQVALHLAAAIGTGVLLGSLAQRLGLPLQLGYLVAGVLLGRLLGAFGETAGTLAVAAEAAVAALLFILALQVPMPALGVRLVVPFGMVLQFLAVTLAGAWLASELGVAARSALVMGAALAASSTIFAVEVLGLRANPATRELLLTGSLFQGGVALTVTTLEFAPGLTGSTAETLARLALIPLFVVGAVIAFRLLSVALEWLGDADEDVALLSVVGVLLLAVGVPAVQAGVPMALIGLAGGWLVAANPRARAVMLRLVGLREVLVAVFLVGFGSLLDPAAILPHAGVVVTLGLVVVALKLASGTVIGRSAGLSRPQAILGAAALAPISELTFVIGQEGVARGVLGLDQQQLLLGAAATTIVAGSAALPIVTSSVARLAARRHVAS